MMRDSFLDGESIKHVILYYITHIYIYIPQYSEKTEKAPPQFCEFLK